MSEEMDLRLYKQALEDALPEERKGAEKHEKLISAALGRELTTKEKRSLLWVSGMDAPALLDLFAELSGRLEKAERK